MTKFFRRLSLSKKLILIGALPLVFLSFISFELYNEKARKVRLLELYSQRIYQSENLSQLIDALQTERKLSFDLSIQRELGKGLHTQRAKTNSYIWQLRTEGDISVMRFEDYTFLKELPAVRRSVDDGVLNSMEIMDSYTNMIYRLNTLNTSFPATRIFLQPVANDLAALRLINEMQTYLGIIRSNIFIALHSKTNVQKTLIGANNVHRVYHSYVAEFNVKTPPWIRERYIHARNNSQLKPTLEYIDTVFRHLAIDNRYDAESWWAVSDEGLNSLRSLQSSLWQITKGKVLAIIDEEKRGRNQTLAFLILALVIVLLLVSYTIHIISTVLRELKEAAGKIAEGDTNVEIPVMSSDAIGSLAESIKAMERQVRERTNALQELNTNLERSNKELEQFAYAASHDLQEPVRKIRTFADHLIHKNYEQVDVNGKKYIDKIAAAADRMRLMINDILTLSQLEKDKGNVPEVALEEVIRNVKADLELLISQKSAVVHTESLPTIQIVPAQANQLFYNLLNNALKFARDNVPPVINIRCSEAPESMVRKTGQRIPGAQYLQIEVQDNGIGFNQEFAGRIFDMFHRLTAERTGTGIGLALCKKIVENHKGHIEATSREGQGTAFIIILPRKQS